MNKENKLALQRAINLAGGKQQALADLLNVKQAHVSYWVMNELPVKRALQIEKALEGQVTRYELRNDIFGNNPTA